MSKRGFKFLIPCVAVLLLTCCKKEPNPQDSSQSATAGRSKYPTVDEKQLQGIVRTRFDSPKPTESQLQRRDKNNKLVRELDLPVLESLPVTEDIETAALRIPQDVAKRCLATAFCAIKGEGGEQPLVDSLIKDYTAASFFSPEENRFIANPTPTKQQLIDFCWRYEAVHVFLWALNARDRLAEASEICPVADDMKLIKAIGPTRFVVNATLRQKREILDAADLYYRLHWAAIEWRLKGKKSDKIDEGIIQERHRALNWLIQYMGQDWDNVKTDT